MTVTGVRSSWEASEVKRCSRLKAVSTLDSIAFKVAVNSPSSSLAAAAGIRVDKSQPAMLLALWMICPIGRRERLAMK